MATMIANSVISAPAPETRLQPSRPGGLLEVPNKSGEAPVGDVSLDSSVYCKY